MKRFIIYILVLTAIASCVNSDGYSVEEDYNGDEIFTSPLIIELGSPRTKSFDESLNWHWKNSDVIYGYQVVGSNIVNSLSKVDGNHFQVDNFRYTSQEPTTFHFIYAGDASLNISRSEERAIKQDSLQSGIWNPVLVGSAVGKLFNEVMNQESVIKMEHLSAALEVRLWKSGVDKDNLKDDDRKKIIYAELSSDSEKFLLDVVPSYSKNGEVSYNVREQEELKGDRVKIEGINKSVVVFNVAPHLEDYPDGALKLVLEDANDERYRVALPAISFGAGERTVVNVEWNGIAKADLPSGKEFNSKVNSFLSENENVTKIKFVANSPVKSEYALVENSVFFVKNNETLEIHTANEQFNANGDCSNMFAGKSLGKFTNLERITSIEFGDSFNTEGVVNMYEMFSNCTNLLSLDLSCFSTSNVTDMSGMFASCNSLADLDISSFDIHSVENLSSMFMYCYGLQSLDLSHFSTQKVINMDWMFYNCFNLSVLDVSSFNTENVTTMHDMFSWCSSLTSLDLSSFDTQSVKDMSYMFLGCSKLDSLDLSTFSFGKSPDVSYMFSGVGELSEYKPIPVYVTKDGIIYLKSKPTYINADFAKLVVKGEEGNLSLFGTANCYIVSKAGTYKFKATSGNSKYVVNNLANVSVLWESFGTAEKPKEGDLISEVSYSGGYVTFSTNKIYREGNAVIAGRDNSGKIVWSWHIWFTDEPKGQTYYNDAGTMMDRNLGATSTTPGDVCALGLQYQWGRKDPFLSSSSIDVYQLPESTNDKWYSEIILQGSPFIHSFSHPMTFIVTRQDRLDWHGYTDDGLWTASKTIYDPCPVGWKVPEGGIDGVWARACGLSDNIYWFEHKYDNENVGFDLSGVLGPSENIWYPLPGYKSASSLGEVYRTGEAGCYWSVTPQESRAHMMSLSNSGKILVVDSHYRGTGASVRCVQE